MSQPKPELPMPARVPEAGFYYHYKHNPQGPLNNYAYEVLGVAFHTESGTEDPPKQGEEHFVIYRPLYESKVYLAQKALGLPCFDARPLEMWMGTVEREGRSALRFTPIVHPDTLQPLMKIRREMYPEG